MYRIAFFSIYAHGHTNPTLPVVRELTCRGHQVRYYSFAPFREKIQAAGAQFVPCDSYLPPAPPDLERRVGRDFAALVEMITQTLLAMDGPVGRDLAQFQPHCVVSDSLCFWGKLWAAKLGLPLCLLHHHLRLQPPYRQADEADAGAVPAAACGSGPHPPLHGPAVPGGLSGEGTALPH